MAPVWSNRKICNKRQWKCTVTIFFLVISPLLAFSQDPSQNPWNQQLDEIYQGGARGFYEDLGKGLKYPRASRKIKNYGTILVEMVIYPNAPLQVIFLNHIDSHIEENLQFSLPEILLRWLPVQHIHRFVLPIRYTINGDYGEIVDVKSPDSCPCLSPTVVHAMSSPVVRIDYFDDYNKQVKKLEKALQQEKHQQTMKYLGELIRFNPFVEELYLARISTESKMGTSKFVTRDQRALELVFGK